MLLIKIIHKTRRKHRVVCIKKENIKNINESFANIIQYVDKCINIDIIVINNQKV